MKHGRIKQRHVFELKADAVAIQLLSLCQKVLSGSKNALLPDVRSRQESTWSWTFFCWLGWHAFRLHGQHFFISIKIESYVNMAQGGLQVVARKLPSSQQGQTSRRLRSNYMDRRCSPVGQSENCNLP